MLMIKDLTLKCATRNKSSIGITVGHKKIIAKKANQHRFAFVNIIIINIIVILLIIGLYYSSANHFIAFIKHSTLSWCNAFYIFIKTNANAIFIIV